MKRIILLTALVFGVLSCNERGEIKESPTDFIKIHGKTYKLIKVVPAYNERAIWIMYPKDSLDEMPVMLNYEVPSGETVIQVN